MPQTHRRDFWIEHPLDQVWPRRLLGVHQNWAFRKPLNDIGVGLLNPFLSSPFSLVNLFLFIASSPINWGMYILHALKDINCELPVVMSYLNLSFSFFTFFSLHFFPVMIFMTRKWKVSSTIPFTFQPQPGCTLFIYLFFWELIVVLVMIWFLFFLSFFITILGLYVIDK